MATRRFYLLAFIGLAIAAIFIGSGVAQTGPAAAPPARLAVCSVTQVFENYARAKDLTAEFEKRRTALSEEDSRRQRAMEAIQVQVEALSPGTPAYAEKTAEYERAGMEREVWRRLEEGKLLREHLTLTREMYSQIIRMVESVAKERGFNLVLYRDEQDLTSTERSELLSKIALRKVLYSSDDIDITDDILKRLNTAYQAAGK